MDQPPASAQETPPTPAERFSLSLSAWLLLALFLLYPLSIGPVFRLTRNNPKSKPILETIYAPLGSLCDFCPPAGRFFDWYVVVCWGVK